MPNQNSNQATVIEPQNISKSSNLMYISKGIVAINTLIFIAMIIYNKYHYNSYADIDERTWLLFGAVNPGKSSLLSCFTMLFLHGSFSHLAINSLSLLALGSKVEKISKKLFLFSYFIGGVISGYAVYLFGSDITVGASGAICSIWAIVIVYDFVYNFSKKLIFTTTIDLSLLVWISSLPHVSASGHAGGFIAGLIIGLFYLLVSKLKATQS